MKLSIAHKLFLTILAAIITMVVSMQLSIQWSFDRGFSRYVHALEMERFDTLASLLEMSYAENGSWHFLKEQPAAWAELLMMTQPEGSDMMHQRHRLTQMLQRPDSMHHAMMHNEPRPFELRVALFDADRIKLWGPRDRIEGDNLRALTSGMQTIGYLGLAIGEATPDERQLDFAQKQKSITIMVALLTALIAAILCIPLSRKLARPVGTLAEGTRLLTRGQFDVRIPVQSHDELGQLSKDFNLLAATLEENETARKQWAADISHELRTPLSILRGEIEALQDGIRIATPQHLDSLHGEVLHLVRLVDDLYELSMSDIGALNYKKETVDFQDILGEVLELYEPRLTEKGLSMTTDLCEDPLLLEADPSRLQQLLKNLLENSLRYTDAGGQMVISLKHQAEELILNLEDTAPGVSPQDLPRLFERLFRVDSARTRRSGGAGLGLSICQNIVLAHGGTIIAGASELGGLRITLRLPLNG